jgi:hypothetical protein
MVVTNVSDEVANHRGERGGQVRVEVEAAEIESGDGAAQRSA